jgi:UDP-glucose 4-epimerase
MIQGKTSERILIIGGSGFIGRHLIERLLTYNYKLRVLDIVKPLWLNHEIEFIEGSFTSEFLLEDAVTNVDYIYHLASTTLPKSSNDDPLYDITSNLAGTVKLLELAIKYKIKKFIFASSGGTVYGIPDSFPVSETASTNPTCSYGIVKLSIEKYLRLFYHLYGLESCSLRMANPFGEYQRFDRAHGAVTVFCHKAFKNETIEVWGDGNISRDFIYIRDVISAMICVLNCECRGEVINIGSGKAESLNEIIGIVENILEKKLKVNYLPPRAFDVPKNYLDISKAKEILNWQPETSLEEGIKKTLVWLKKENEISAKP